MRLATGTGGSAAGDCSSSPSAGTLAPGGPVDGHGSTGTDPPTGRLWRTTLTRAGSGEAGER